MKGGLYGFNYYLWPVISNNMTPKEKAQDLFGQMKGFRVKYSHSKRCAIRAAEECRIVALIAFNETEEEYWHQVKTEIEKL